MMRNVVCLLLIFTLLSCRGTSPMNNFELKQPVTPEDVTTVPSSYPPEQVKQGQYLAQLLSCGTCHTDGALTGAPNYDRQYAGSKTGIAYSNPFENENPGILYPANITPDNETGIGLWMDEELLRLLRSGVDVTGRRHIPVMPWPAYRNISDSDAMAIVAFLRSLPPIQHQVPKNVKPGTPSVTPYVHFGVYHRR